MMLIGVRPSPPFVRRQTNGGVETNTTETTTSGAPTPSFSPSSLSNSSSSSSSSPSPTSSSVSTTITSVSSTATSSTSSPSATLSSETQRSSGVPTSTLIGAIVGGAIGLVLLLVLLSILFTACRRRRNDVQKRPQSSVVLDGMLPSRSKRPKTIYNIDSFLGSAKPSHEHHKREMSDVPLLPDGSRPGTAYDPSDGVDEHGVVDRYTDGPPPSPASTAPHTEFPHLVSPYSADGHGDDVVHQSPPIASLSMSSHSTGTTFVPLTVPPAGFSVRLINEQSNGSASESQDSTSPIPTIPPPPSSSHSTT
ncbi:hypothetical protein E1B28_010135 [Marasmius oreades]|uniref:Uncharacterized protein n=1 Tax=Marasmius oreades TaxID=181124 RepID=A0A9P7RXZ5_9AGAR|nr:uncharacterized protein E1B28_010135 [Marasmius oreades]KAG7091078.1 hypothetical protein E1B28_010135 [Marasmius oreades]